MRALFCIFLILFSSIYSCKRPERSLNNSPDTNKTYNRSNSTEPRKTISRPDNVTSQSNSSTTKKTIPKSRSISDLFQELQDEVFIIYSIDRNEEVSQGSGFFIAPGIGVTNYHVLEDSENSIISIKDEVYEITDFMESSNSSRKDYVIFKTGYRTSNPLKISKKRPRIGEDIFAIGSPKGLSNSLTKGTISGFRENDRIQIDATIDHGSSGGPLFNLKGEVIGITTSGMGTGSELNFAVDIQAINYERFIHN